MPELSHREIRALIDPPCDAFEASWQNGHRPSLQELANQAPDQVRSALFSELLAIELELRTQSGESPTLRDYREQYADFTDEVNRIFAEHSVWLEDNSELSTGSAAAEVDVKTQPLVGSTTETAETDRRSDGQRIPDQIGRYRIERLLGRGGMGEVLLAEDTILNRPVAIKLPVFSEQNRDELVARFYREARAMAKVRHPNLCPVYEIGEIDGRPFLAMAYIEGETLAEKLKAEGPIPPAKAADIVRTLALAIAVAHERGVIHRDLKPGNVMIDGGGIPLVTDFGLASSVEQDDVAISTTGAPIGTPAYMSPEQVAGDSAAIGPTTDVYALGIILYELLTGKRPFDGKGLAALGQITSGQAPPRPSTLVEVPPGLEAVCEKAMAHDAAERYQTAEDLARALETYDQTLAPVTRPSKKPIAAVAIGLLLLPLLIMASELLLRTPAGKVIVSAADGTDVRIELRNGGEVVGVLGPENQWRLDVEAGQYKVSMLSPGYEIAMQDNTIVVSRNGVAEVTIKQLPEAPTSNVNHALRFDAEQSYVHVPGIRRLNEGEMTLEAWVRPLSYHSDPKVIARLHGSSLLQLGRSSNWFFAMDGRASIPFARVLGEPAIIPRYETGHWYHVAVVSDESTLTLFTDGNKCWTLPRNQTADPGNGEGLYIGAQPDNGVARYFFEGEIDEMRVSTVARYTDEFAPKRRFEADDATVALFHFDEGLGTELLDSSRNRLHGTIYRATWQHVETAPNRKKPLTSVRRTFTVETYSSGTGFSTRGILLDLDGDKDLDAFVTNYDAPDSVLWNDGSGKFTDSGQKIANAKSVGVAFGDLDGDGDPDVFVPTVGAQPNRVYINDGKGLFFDSGQELGKSGSKAALLHDFDRDGDLDAFVANYAWGEENRLYLNDGAAVFANSGLTFGDAPSFNATLADFDNDGDHDVFVANGRETPNRLYLNDGSAELRDSGQSLGTASTLACAAGDVDGDGDLDIVAANRSTNKVWLNDGNGVFTDSGFDFEDQDSWHVALGDIDLDGDLDAFVCNHGTNSVWYNDGSGHFGEPEYYLDDKSHYADLGDLDGDGDLDVFIVNENAPIRVLFNTRLSK